MSQNIFDLKKKRGRKRKLQNSGDCSLSRSGSCDEPLQFDEKIENLNQDQDTIETTLAMMIKTQEITTLTAHHEIIPEESPRSRMFKCEALERTGKHLYYAILL